MTTESNSAPAPGWTLWQAVIWAGIPFLLGATLGIAVRRLQLPDPATVTTPRPDFPRATGSPATADKLKALGDEQAAPLLAELKSKPDDPTLLAKVGNVYLATRNFEQACTYFERSLQIKDDTVLRTELGRALYYAGDSDGALAEFEKVLKSDPDNANAMFNLGMVKWQSRFDVDGAIAAWQQLLKKHPRHPRRAEVEKLIARARQHRDVKSPARTGAPQL